MVRRDGPRHAGGDCSGAGDGARHAGSSVGFWAGVVGRVLPVSPVVALVAAVSATGCVAMAQDADSVAGDAGLVPVDGTVAASRSWSREPLDADDGAGEPDDGSVSVEVDADSDWGGIESITIPYTQSTGEREALGKLLNAVRKGEQVHGDSRGKLLDDDSALRDELGTELESARSVGESKTRTVAQYDKARESLEKQTTKVSDAMTLWKQVREAERVAAQGTQSGVVNDAAADQARTLDQMSSAGSTGRGSEMDKSEIKAPNGKTGRDVVNYALQFVGKVPYVWGGTTTRGWDCSGYVQYVYAQFGVNLPRVSGAQAGAGREVSLSEAKPGDIVANGSHAAIYIGDGMVVNALNPSEGTKVTGLNVFYGGYSIRRVLG